MEFDRPRLWVRRLEYPKYKIPSQPNLQIVQAEREVSLIPGGSFGFGIAAEVLFSKFALHVPLYRQQDPFAQLGWAPNRSTLCQIVSTAADLLWPLVRLVTQRVLAASVINNDAERDLRRVAVGRRNWLFVGSHQGGERTAVILTIIASAHRHDLDE